MTTRQHLLAMTAAAALLALPALARAQGSAGSSMMPQASQTNEQQGPQSGSPGARAGANAGQATGQAVPGDNAGSGGGSNNATSAPRNANTVQNPNTPHAGQAPVQAPGTAGGQGSQPAQGLPSGSQATTGPNAGQQQQGSQGQPAPGGRGQQGSSATGAGVGPTAVDSAALRDGRRASRLIGSAVYNENNESIGEVDDIMIPRGGGSPFAVISVGGFLGIGAKLVAVPYDRLQSNSNRWTLTGATKESLGSLPTFAYDASSDRRG